MSSATLNSVSAPPVSPAARLYHEILDPNGFDYSVVSIEELLAVRKFARDLLISGDYATRRRALGALVEIEDALMIRLAA